MTPKERAAMQQALEDLKKLYNSFVGYVATYEADECFENAKQSITALREALEQPVSQEPVAWAISHSLGLEFGSKYPMQETKEAAEQMARQHMGAVVVTPLYAAPVQPVSEPVALNEDEGKAMSEKFAEMKTFLHEPENWDAGDHNKYFSFFCWGWDYAKERYAAPQPVKEVELTDDDLNNAKRCLPRYYSEITDEDLDEFARAVIAADRRKNK